MQPGNLTKQEFPFRLQQSERMFSVVPAGTLIGSQ